MKQNKNSFKYEQQAWYLSLLSGLILLLIPGNSFRWSLLSKLGVYPPLWYTRRKIKTSFRQRLGFELNLNGRRFNEKIQLLKLHYRPEICIQLADKYSVRDFVENNGLGHLLVPLFGVYESADQINFDSLPEAFVIKVTHDSGGVWVVRNKAEEDISLLRREINRKLSRPYINGIKRGEWQYLKIKPQVIIEGLLQEFDQSEQAVDLKDYKLHCFDGIVCWIHVDIDRNSEHKRDFYTRDWEKLTDLSVKFPNTDCLLDKPVALQEMIDSAERIARDFPYCRIDFYEVDGKPYFGEVTFHHGNGMEAFSTPEWEHRFGEKITWKQ